MVLQLSGSAGMFPIQLSGGFFQAIHPFLPMTYGIEGLRRTISVGTSAGHDFAVLLGIAVCFNGLLWAYFTWHKARISKKALALGA